MNTGSYIQGIIDGIGQAMKIQRAKGQMTLGQMIECLTLMPPDHLVAKIESPHCYRGYYTDLAVKCEGGETPAHQVLSMLRECLGKTFTGYKGGDFVMESDTPMWVASYGNLGQKIVAINSDGSLSLSEDE